jgi:glycine dehydrogenase subunit 1
MVNSFSLNHQDLYKDLPKKIIDPSLDLPEHLTEAKLQLRLENIANKNVTYLPNRTFLSGGVYNNHVPAIVDHLASRSEFYTAYTPYQPEISQGTLVAIYEFQTYMAQLTGMEISNASLYDGATALAEAVQMTVRVSKKNKVKVLLTGIFSPNYVGVLNTYNKGFNNELIFQEEISSINFDDNLDAIVFSYPNFFGQVNDYKLLIEECKKRAIAVIFSVPNPLALMLFKSPGELGADIVCGEASSFGSYPFYGGPKLGFLSTREDFVRYIPGRIVGETLDASGKKGFVLTFQTREQHIKREKATSNICSNQGLLALRASIYFSYMGQKGLLKLAEDIYEKTQYLKKCLAEFYFFTIDKNVSFNETLIYSDYCDFAELNKFLQENNILGGLDLFSLRKDWKDFYLLSVNEYTQKEDIDYLIKLIKEFFRE